MPRKPSSVFVIAATPSSTVSVAGMPPSQHQAWRIPLEDDETTEDVVRRHYAEHPFGTTFFVVEDTKVDAWVITLGLDPVDDARLKDDEDDGGVVQIAKNTVDGGNPSEPIHGFDGATAGEIIQSVVQVKAGTDFPFDPFVAHDQGTFGYASGTAPATVDVPSTSRLRAVQVLAGSTFAAVTIGGGATIGIPAGTSWEVAIAGLAVGTDVVITGSVASYFVSWVT